MKGGTLSYGHRHVETRFRCPMVAQNRKITPPANGNCGSVLSETPTANGPLQLRQHPLLRLHRIEPRVRSVRTPSTQQDRKLFLDDLSSSGPAVRLSGQGEVMTQYLVAIYRAANYDPAVSEDEAMGREIDVLNEQMEAAGVRVFAGGLQPESSARSLRLQTAGKVLITDGPYVETKEHMGGFWVLKATDWDEALEWGRKAAVACRASVEVRPFH